MSKSKKILIIGGGQLGMMMAQSVEYYDFKIAALDPNRNCSAAKYVEAVVTADFFDADAIAAAARISDVITYEFENISEDALANFAAKLPQGIQANKISKNRIEEKKFIKQLGYETAAFCVPKTLDDVKNFVKTKAILKTVLGGYDGKGQYLIKNSDFSEVEKLDFSKGDYILEDFVDFDYEISVVATRDKFNNTYAFPITRNIHKDQMLFISKAEKKYQVFHKEAEKIIKKVMKKFKYVGTLCIEFFVVGGILVINEIAPRPHNSGHVTQDSCDVSQFKQHMKAITGMEIERPRLLQETYMINLIGEDYKYLNQFDSKHVIPHDYFKTEIRPGRKMGHLNITDKDVFERIVEIIKGDE